MKKFIGFAVVLLFSAVLYAQKDVTEFLGIPVDGTKQQMIENLKAKGFVYDSQKDVLSGEFNGEEVSISIQTQGNKVWRVTVVDENYRDETQIKIRFNKLVRQFENKESYLECKAPYWAYYIKASALQKGLLSEEEIPELFDDFLYVQKISDNENIGNGIMINKKKYQALFHQLSKSIDEDAEEVVNKFQKELKELQNSDEYKEVTGWASQYTEDEYTEEMIKRKDKIDDLAKSKFIEYIKAMERAVVVPSSMKQVWFTIAESGGQYGIMMFYENKYNKADGSDL
ncbi:MAG TPA: hypothetical protein IAC47_05720 [Candidatus Onthomorpha intestinigallinarum]|uniref:Uncharacterized protein n=1 Tax=Candidatus Onthomorpha intestinigallinarum TaxID=2840880 RepID=A0A9D1RGC5_9BACT|nr:hypothetical protein [Candidatus Onthomorpha intestinigallinarum]